MTRGKLLLVDDDPSVLDSMAGWLRDQGFEVDEAGGVEPAIRQVDSQLYDLVLADIRLRDGDGFEILTHCREQHPDLLVILLTGYATVETGVEAIRAGAFDLLTNSISGSPVWFRFQLSQLIRFNFTRCLQGIP